MPKKPSRFMPSCTIRRIRSLYDTESGFFMSRSSIAASSSFLFPESAADWIMEDRKKRLFSKSAKSSSLYFPPSPLPSFSQDRAHTCSCNKVRWQFSDGCSQTPEEAFPLHCTKDGVDRQGYGQLLWRLADESNSKPWTGKLVLPVKSRRA